jgi:hypothetical protein
VQTPAADAKGCDSEGVKSGESRIRLLALDRSDPGVAQNATNFNRLLELQKAGLVHIRANHARKEPKTDIPNAESGNYDCDEALALVFAEITGA